MTTPGHLTELQQALSLHLKAFSHYGLVVLSGYVLVEVAVGAPPEAVRPLQREGRSPSYKLSGILILDSKWKLNVLGARLCFGRGVQEVKLTEPAHVHVEGSVISET